MSRVNPETAFTNVVRAVLQRNGAYFIKVSDRFTIGVPDAVVCTSTRVIVVEFKVLRRSVLGTATYSELGLSGAQDSRIREFYARAKCSYVVAEQPDGTPTVWVPVAAATRGGYYRQLDGDVYQELLK